MLFQFTPLREGRQPRNRQARCSAHFNSRSSARGDLSEYRVRRILIISIHAPPRGATGRLMAWSDFLDISIHAPPRGATEKLRRLMILTTYFNSRPSARGDALWQGGHAPSPISIHAPPRGATRELIKKYYTSKFQFTPLREGRLNVMLATIYNFISIHAPPRGATSSELRRVARSRNFNSRPSARGDFPAS